MIIIASSNKPTAEYWVSTLSQEFEIYNTIASSKHMLEKCLKKVKCEVLLIDHALLQDEGVHELSDLMELQPATKFILFNDYIEQREEVSAILFGVKAYLNTEIAPHDLLNVVKKVMDNEIWVDRQFLTRLLKEIQEMTQAKRLEGRKLNQGLDKMTPRESEIAKLVATGASNRRIAQCLSISERTVKAHLGVIFKKMGLHDRLQLALYMNRHHQLAHVWQAHPNPKKFFKKT